MRRPLTDLEFTPQYRGGTGAPLVLLHGGTATWHVWSSVIPRLVGGHDVLAPTLPGHHGGPAFDGKVDIDAIADGVERVMDRAGFDRAHIAGNSLGGWTAMELARRGRALSVVALSPAGGWQPGDRRVRFAFVSADRMLRTTRPLLPLLMRSPAIRRAGFRRIAEHCDRLTPEATLTAIEGILGVELQAGLDLLDQSCRPLPDPGVPVLLAWAEKDRLLPAPRYSAPWRNAVPTAEWRVLPGVGHVPMIDDPELVARTILDWTTWARSGDHTDPLEGQHGPTR